MSLRRASDSTASSVGFLLSVEVEVHLLLISSIRWAMPSGVDGGFHSSLPVAGGGDW